MSTNLPADLTSAGWDLSAELYEAEIRPGTARYCEDALRFADVKRGERVLDVACGPGTLSLEAAALGADVLATDFAPAMIARLRAKIAEGHLRNIRAEVMDGQALSVPDASFDAAFSIFGLIFFPDRAKGFRELARALKPGGRAVVASWAPPSRVRILGVFSDAMRAALPDLPPPASPPAIFSLQDPERLRAEMTAGGFRDVRVYATTHEWVMPNARYMWERFGLGSPVFRTALAGMPESKREAVREAFYAIARKEFGNGPLHFPCEAFVGLGWK